MSDPLFSSQARLNSVASSSPGRLLFRGWFWTSQRSFLMVCGAALATLIFLASYTYVGVGNFVFLTLFIHALALWGALLTIRAIAKLQVETAILKVIDAKASDLLRALKSKQITAIELDTLEARILPDNPQDPPASMIRMFQHICKEARDRKFESSVNVLEPYREEPLEELFKLQNLQKIALWLGILGTFIGLMMAIRDGNLSDLEKIDKLPEVVQSMFSDLYVSFSASLAGLEVAVILGFFLLLLRKKQESYFELMESAVVTMLSLARNSLNRDNLVAEFSQASTAMNQLTDTLATQTTVLSNRLDDLQKQIITQNAQIKQGLEKLMTAGKDFDGFLSRLNEGQRQFVDDVRTVYDALTLKGLGTTLQTTIVKTGKLMTETITPSVAMVSTQLAEFNKSVTTLNGTLKTHSKEVGDKLQHLEGEVRQQTSGSVKTLQTLKREISTELTRLNDSQSNRNDARQLQQSISFLDRKIDSLGRGYQPKPGLIDRLRRWISYS